MTVIERERQVISAPLSAVLEIRELSVSMLNAGRRQTILHGISLLVDPGQILAIVGRSGSGKSTLAHVMNGLLPSASQPAVSGSIRIAGREIIGATDRELRKIRKSLIRVIPQDPLEALNPTMIIRRQLAETSSTQVAKERLLWAGMSDFERITRSFPHELSGGERQRVLITMATVANVPLIVADEPTTGLDPRNKARVIKLLRDLADRGAAILINTHDLSVAEASDRIMVLDAGVVVEVGRTSEVMSTPKHQTTGSLIAARFYPAWPQTDLFEPVIALGTKGAEKHRPGIKQDTQPPPTSDTCAVVLNMKNVSKTFETRRLFGVAKVDVLLSINMVVSAGECVALIGPSGVGKSTLLKVAAGLIKPTSGDVTLCSEDRPQLIFQDAKSFLTPWMPIGEQIMEGLRSKNGSAASRCERMFEMLDFVGLKRSQSKALPYELSVGQCQRAVIARALAVSPRLLLCDEPISALDTVLAASTVKLLRQIRLTYGTAMVFATHDLAAAQAVADRIVILRQGKLFSVLNKKVSRERSVPIDQSSSC
ncbi:ABC transporter ATP-binding protein [Endobacterium cereale]|uniref:ABC transporter ATP-binding protein n=1 Tax=Endobacterium cereale TaxID=2663029 RepID=UPI002B487ECE|nr:ABC transporter ATP-binding protein [Endobacterium cereale]MEB2848061.1 ABC transporter ATP-binding protein [Endobacterium cereale]